MRNILKNEEGSFVLGRDLKDYDVIDVWWAPNRDTIVKLEEYTGPIKFDGGAKIAFFAQNEGGMTIINEQYYKVLNVE